MVRIFVKSLKLVVECTVVACLVVLLWAVFAAKPLVMENHKIFPLRFTAGDKVVVESTSYKPGWAVRYCRAQQDAAFFIDSEGLTRAVTQLEETKLNYNDGNKMVFRTEVRAPLGLALGYGKLYYSVTYRCFNGLWTYQVFTEKNGAAQFYVQTPRLPIGKSPRLSYPHRPQERGRNSSALLSPWRALALLTRSPMGSDWRANALRVRVSGHAW